MLMIDTHVHVVARDGDAKYPRAESAARADWVVTSAVDMEALLPRLDRAEVGNQQVADELVISLNTVRRHMSNIFGKTGAANRAEAVSYAHRHALV